jgi:hypothetical protein
MGMGECRRGADSSVRRLFWLVPHQAARLSLRADCVGEAGDTCSGDRTQELVEWPGRVEVGRLLVERGSDALRVEVVELQAVRRASGSGGIRTSQRWGRNPARVTVTSRRTAALDGRLLAAVSAWRQ